MSVRDWSEFLRCAISIDISRAKMGRIRHLWVQEVKEWLSMARVPWSGWRERWLLVYRLNAVVGDVLTADDHRRKSSYRV